MRGDRAALGRICELVDRFDSAFAENELLIVDGTVQARCSPTSPVTRTSGPITLLAVTQFVRQSSLLIASPT
jgi:hypothetical protein